MTEPNFETAIAALNTYNETTEFCDCHDDSVISCLQDAYHLLSKLIIEGYDFKPNGLDDPVILRKFPDFIPTRIPALWQNLACQGSRCTNTLCPDIQAVINKAVGIRRPATPTTPEYRRSDLKAQTIAKRAFEAALRVLWFLREIIEQRGHFLTKDKDANPFMLWPDDNYTTVGSGITQYNMSEFVSPHGVNYWQGQIDALLEELPPRPLENSADFEQFKKIIEIARALKLTPGSKHGNDDYRIEGTVPLSNLFNCLTPLENKTAEDMLFALKTICPDIHDWDIVIGALLNPACQPRTFQKTLSRLVTASDLPTATVAGDTTTTCTPTLSNEHV